MKADVLLEDVIMRASIINRNPPLYRQNPGLLSLDADEPSEEMMSKIKELVPQDQFTADESI